MICEHGLRSSSACRLLAEHGYGPLYNLDRGLEDWPGPIKTGPGQNGHHELGIAPSSFLVESFDLLPKGLALDLAMGEGRNAIYLATREDEPEAQMAQSAPGTATGAPAQDQACANRAT